MLFVANLFHFMLFCVNCVPHNPAQIFVWQNMNGGGNWIHWSKHFNTPNSTWQAAIKHLNLLNFLLLLPSPPTLPDRQLSNSLIPLKLPTLQHPPFIVRKENHSGNNVWRGEVYSESTKLERIEV